MEHVRTVYSSCGALVLLISSLLGRADAIDVDKLQMMRDGVSQEFVDPSATIYSVGSPRAIGPYQNLISPQGHSFDLRLPGALAYLTTSSGMPYHNGSLSFPMLADATPVALCVTAPSPPPAPTPEPGTLLLLGSGLLLSALRHRWHR